MSRSTRTKEGRVSLVVKKRKRDVPPDEADKLDPSASPEKQTDDTKSPPEDTQNQTPIGSHTVARFSAAFPEFPLPPALVTLSAGADAAEAERQIVALPKGQERDLLLALFRAELSVNAQRALVTSESDETAQITKERISSEWPAHHFLTQHTAQTGTLFSFCTLQPECSSDLPRPPRGAEWIRASSTEHPPSTRVLRDICPPPRLTTRRLASIRPVEFLNYGPFASFACRYDSGAAQVGYDDSVTLWETLKRRRTTEHVKVPLTYRPAGAEMEDELQTNEILLTSLHNTPDASTAAELLERLAWCTNLSGVTGRAGWDLTGVRSGSDVRGRMEENERVMSDVQVWEDV